MPKKQYWPEVVYVIVLPVAFFLGGLLLLDFLAQ